MNSKSYTIVVTNEGFAIMETTVFWHIRADGEYSVANMSIRKIETLVTEAGNTYEDAENRLRGWYRAAAISMKG